MIRKFLSKRVLVVFVLMYSSFIIALFIFNRLFHINENLIAAFRITTPLISILIGLYCIFSKNLNRGTKISILSLISTIVCWLVADIIWLWYENAVVSPADILFFLGYFFIFYAIIREVSSLHRHFFLHHKKGVFFIVIFALLSFLYFYYFPLEWNVQQSLIENIVTVGYVVVDFILLASILCILIPSFFGHYTVPWMFITLSLIFSMTGDIFYNIQSSTYQSGDLLDIAWMQGNLWMAIGFVYLWDEQGN